MIERAKELRARFETWNVLFGEEEFVNTIVIPTLSPACAEVSEHHRKFADYPKPDPGDVQATSIYLHLVKPVSDLDEILFRP